MTPDIAKAHAERELEERPETAGSARCLGTVAWEHNGPEDSSWGRCLLGAPVMWATREEWLRVRRSKASGLCR